MTYGEVVTLVRAVRAAYDQLGPMAKATLRRCATADEVRIEGTYWRLVDDADLPRDGDIRSSVAHVVACFDAAGTGSQAFATWLRRKAYGEVRPGDLPTRALRFRRLLAARDRDELVHHLRGLLRHGFQKSKVGIDWGALGADVIFFGHRVRQKWAEEFFTQAKAQANTGETLNA